MGTPRLLVTGKGLVGGLGSLIVALPLLIVVQNQASTGVEPLALSFVLVAVIQVGVSGLVGWWIGRDHGTLAAAAGGALAALAGQTALVPAIGVWSHQALWQARLAEAHGEDLMVGVLAEVVTWSLILGSLVPWLSLISGTAAAAAVAWVTEPEDEDEEAPEDEDEEAPEGDQAEAEDDDAVPAALAWPVQLAYPTVLIALVVPAALGELVENLQNVAKDHPPDVNPGLVSLFGVGGAGLGATLGITLLTAFAVHQLRLGTTLGVRVVAGLQILAALLLSVLWVAALVVATPKLPGLLLMAAGGPVGLAVGTSLGALPAGPPVRPATLWESAQEAMVYPWVLLFAMGPGMIWAGLVLAMFAVPSIEPLQQGNWEMFPEPSVFEIYRFGLRSFGMALLTWPLAALPAMFVGGLAWLVDRFLGG